MYSLGEVGGRRSSFEAEWRDKTNCRVVAVGGTAGKGQDNANFEGSHGKGESIVLIRSNYL